MKSSSHSKRLPFQFNEKSIPFAANQGEWNPRKKFLPPGYISAGRIPKRICRRLKTKNPLDIDISKSTERFSPPGKTRDSASLYILTTYHHIIILGLLDEVREVPWIVREITVHLKDRIKSPLKRPCQALNIRGRKPKFPRATNEVKSRVGMLQLLHEDTCLIGRTVVDNNNVSFNVISDTPNYMLNIRALTIRRDNYYGAHCCFNGPSTLECGYR